MFLLIVDFTNHKAAATMDDGKASSDHQHSVLNYEPIHSAERNCLGTIKVH